MLPRKAAAEDLYRTDASQRLLTSFYPCDGEERTIYLSHEEPLTLQRED
jgi:hypothetical protein